MILFVILRRYFICLGFRDHVAELFCENYYRIQPICWYKKRSEPTNHFLDYLLENSKDNILRLLNSKQNTFSEIQMLFFLLISTCGI